MKTIAAGIGLFIASFVFLFQIALLAVIFEPHWFRRGVGESSTGSAGSDSLATVNTADVRVGADSAKGTASPEQMRKNSRPDSAAADLQQQLNFRGAQVEVQPATNERPIEQSSPASSIDSARQADIRAKAKLIESMDAESAAKILSNLEDADVKGILMSVKKRQAGKILGLIEPVRAARIIR